MRSARPLAKPREAGWPAPSAIAIFVRNLKLLHLDKYSDWPGITIRTFNSSQQNLRHRVKAVEWSLYHLFAIWDPEGTEQKLRPFFPPLEPLQSVNLRAALFRALSDVKKNGVLGRETIIRKTMLDDCKGEKLDEVLAVFSTAVLRKFVASGGGAQNPAMRLSTSSKLTQDEQDKLLPLILAYRTSLSSIVNQKMHLRENYDRFDQFLNTKAEELARRSKQVPQLPPETGDGLGAVHHDVKSAWLGNEKWADAILEGGIQVSTDSTLELPFPKVWPLAKEGKLDARGSRASPDLLADLEARIAQQRARLQQWRQLKRALDKEEDAMLSAKPLPSKAQPLLFKDHQTLTIATITQSSQGGRNVPLQHPEYESLISALNSSLSKFKGRSSLRDESASSRGLDVHHTVDQDSERESVSNNEESGSPTEEQVAGSNLLNDYSTRPLSSSQKTSSIVEEQEDCNQGQYANNLDSQPVNVTPPVTSDSPVSNADEDSALSELKFSKPIPRSAATLVERTRQSMSLLPAPGTRPRRSTTMRSRHSQVYPVNPFEYSDKSKPGDKSSGTSTPREELFSQDAPYSSVFKSRPRIATSPVISPAVPAQSLGDDAGDIDHSADVSPSDFGLESSPLVRSRTRRRA